MAWNIIDLFIRKEEAPGPSNQIKTTHPLAVRSAIAPSHDLALGVLGIVSLVLIWCGLTYGGIVRPFFLPSPTGIWHGLKDLDERGLLVPAILRSTWRVTKALLLVTAIGVPIGVLMGTFTPVDALLRKIVNGAKSVPPTGILGLVVLWFGYAERGKVVFLLLGAIFFMIILTKNAIQSVNEDYVRVAIDLGASRWQTLRYVLLRGAWPQIWDGMAVCNGIMWTYIVLVEFLNANLNNENLGLGVLLRSSTIVNRPGEVFATLILIALISSLTDFVIFRCLRKLFFNW